MSRPICAISKGQAMTIWFVEEIHLTAHYFNHADDAAVLPCRSVSLLPEEFKSKSGADGTIQRSITKPSRLVL